LLFARVQAVLARKPRTSPGAPSKETYVLRGLGKCQCGGSLLFRRVKGRAFFYCSRQSNVPHQYSCFSPQHQPLDPLELSVKAGVLELIDTFQRDDVLGKMMANLGTGRRQRLHKVGIARGKLEELDREKKRLVSAIARGTITEDDADLEFKRIREGQEHWDAQVDGYLASDDHAQIERYIAQMDDLGRVIRHWVPNSSPEEWKAMLNALLDCFIVHEDCIELRFTLGGITPEHLAEVLSERVVSEWAMAS
jgi:hypothetical protein